MVITKIERQKKRKDRVNIYADGEYLFPVAADVLAKFGLRKGDVLNDSVVAQLQRAEEFTRAKERALRLLGLRPRSEREIRHKLAEKEYPPNTIEAVIEHLRTLGLLNDHAFAEAFVRDALKRKPAGERLLRRQLLLKGINKEIISSVLSSLTTNDSEQILARNALEAYLRRSQSTLAGLAREKRMKRIADFLARRGFGWETISSVMKEQFPPS